MFFCKMHRMGRFAQVLADASLLLGLVANGLDAGGPPSPRPASAQSSAGARARGRW
jgi:hypothetical protein